MPQEKLVLLKPKGQRLAEAIIVPVAALPIGPAMRALMGEQYDPSYGTFTLVIWALLASMVTSRFVLFKGAQWMSPSERNERLIAEAAAEPSWLFPVATAAALALSMVAILLTLDPLDNVGSVFGGPPMAFGFIGVMSTLIAAQVFYARRKLTRQFDESKTETTKASDAHMEAKLSRPLPLYLTYLAYILALLAGFAVARQFQDDNAFSAYLVTSIILSQALVLLFMQLTRTNGLCVASTIPNLAKQIFAGVTLWGLPFGLLMSGCVAMEMADKPMAHRVAMVAITIALSTVGGLFYGLIMYIFWRSGDPRRKSI